MLCFLAVSGSTALRPATGLPILASSEMRTETTAGLKTGGSLASRTSTVTVDVEVDTGPENGDSLVTTTSRVKLDSASKSSSLEGGAESKDDACWVKQLETKEALDVFPPWLS